MPEDVAAVMDSPAVDAAPSISDAPVDSGVPAAGTPDGSAAPVDNADTPQPGETGHLRGTELYRAVKEQLKALDPKLARSVRNAIHIADRADKLAGGDLDAIEASRQAVAKLADDPEAGLAPEQIIEQTLAERTFWRDFDSKFEKGDPAVIEQMATTNPEAFQQLVVPAVNKFAQVNPEGYSSLIARAAMGYFNSQDIPLQFQILQTFLPSMPEFPGKDRVVAAINRIFSTTEDLKGMAEKPLTPKKAEGKPDQQGGIDSREEKLQQREMMATRREWDGETSRPGVELRVSELNRLAGASKVTLTDAEKDKIKAAVNEEVNTRLAARPDYGKAMRGYLQSGNKKAYMDRARSEYQKLIPTAVKRAFQDVVDERKTAPRASGQAGATAKPTAQPAKPVNDGSGNLTQWIAGHPKTMGKQIDYGRTTNGMLQKKEAYLKGEKNLFRWK